MMLGPIIGGAAAKWTASAAAAFDFGAIVRRRKCRGRIVGVPAVAVGV